jgi:hypothetical protein
MSSNGETFIFELRQIARSQDLVDRLIDSWRGKPIYLTAERGNTPSRVNAALTILKAGATRQLARQRLMARYGVSRATAYRILQAAMREQVI